MTTDEFEKLIEGATETQRIDFKKPVKWDVYLFIKDFLAMSNVQDGGWIIIGIEEDKKNNRFNRIGVNEKIEKSYNHDLIKDQISSYCSSPINFDIYFPVGFDNKKYVVIKIKEFDEIPIICIKSNEKAQTKASTIYYRNTDKKIESAPISNYRDLHKLIFLSTKKIYFQFKDLLETKKYNVRLININKKLKEFYGDNDDNFRSDLLKKIKSRSYFELIFTPNKNQSLDISECKNVIKNSHVELRGWDYPHFPMSINASYEKTYFGDDFCEGYIDWGDQKEIWRFYQDGFFIHIKAFRESWIKESVFRSNNFFLKEIDSNNTLEFIWFIYQITEQYEFLNRLIINFNNLQYFRINITLYNIKDRRFQIFTESRIPLSGNYATGSNKLSLSKDYYKDEFLDNPHNYSLETIFYFLKRFNWENPPIEVIKDIQSKLLKK